MLFALVSTCVYPAITEVTGTYPKAQLLRGHQGFRLRFSSLYSKYFTHWLHLCSWKVIIVTFVVLCVTFVVLCLLLLWHGGFSLELCTW